MSRKESLAIDRKIDVTKPFGFYEIASPVQPSLASCQCGSGLACSGSGSGGSCQCGSGLDCSGGGSGGASCQCGSGLNCSGSG